jgi:hypothetical protein
MVPVVRDLFAASAAERYGTLLPGNPIKLRAEPVV